MRIALDDLEAFAPRPAVAGDKQATWDLYADAICSEAFALVLERRGINSPLRWAHLVARLSHECGGFTKIWESGAYSAERIVAVFGSGHSAKVSSGEASRLAGNAYALFERVYGIGNPLMAARLGNKVAGDGYNFRGLGPGQITGGDAHRKYAEEIGCTVQELVHPINALHATAIMWQDKGCRELSDADDARAICKRWNGALNGLEDQLAQLARAKKIWPTAGPVAVPLTPAGNVARSLKLGDSDFDADGPADEIKGWQELLAKAGFHPGTIDGHFGKLTKRAVIAFQGAHALPATGEIDHATGQAIAAAEPVHIAGGIAGRASLTGDDLLAQGSRIVGSFRAIAWRALAGVWAGAIAIFDKLLGFDVLSGLITHGEKIAASVKRTSALLAPFVDPQLLLGIGIVIVASGLYSYARKGEAARVSDSQTGATIGAGGTATAQPAGAKP